jgi:hypothetical protein
MTTQFFPATKKGNIPMPVFHNPAKRTVTGDFESVVIDFGWPPEGLVARPNDPTGAAILDYVAKFKNHKDFPDSSWSSRHGEIFLRDLDEPEAPDDEQPRYRVVAATAFIGCTLYARGDVVPFSGWPSNMAALEPANISAERVIRYATKYGAGRNLVGQPWSAGKLHLESPATFGRPESARPRWAGNSAA